MDKELLKKINTELDELIKEYESKGDQYDLVAAGIRIALGKINNMTHIYDLLKK